MRKKMSCAHSGIQAQSARLSAPPRYIASDHYRTRAAAQTFEDSMNTSSHAFDRCPGANQGVDDNGKSIITALGADTKEAARTIT
jgi:hypothetical protein